MAHGKWHGKLYGIIISKMKEIKRQYCEAAVRALAVVLIKCAIGEKMKLLKCRAALNAK